MVCGHLSATPWAVWTRESVVRICSEAVSTGPSELTRLRWAQLETDESLDLQAKGHVFTALSL